MQMYEDLLISWHFWATYASQTHRRDILHKPCEHWIFHLRPLPGSPDVYQVGGEPRRSIFFGQAVLLKRLPELWQDMLHKAILSQRSSTWEAT